MNQEQNNDKDRVMKTLAIVGFFAVIVLGVWLAVQVVSLVPSAFSSLASIADSVYNYNPAAEESEETTQPDIEVGEGITLTTDEFPPYSPEEENSPEEETPEVVDEDELEEPEETTVDTTEPSTPAYTGPQYIETVTYSVPTSDPNGYVDLAVKVVAVGHLDNNGNFIQRRNVDNEARAAFQFEVKNIGTKTSDSWDLTATLTSGQKFEAPTQLPLKPQERVVFTLGFDNVGTSGISTIGATVHSDDDQNSSNDSFTWAVSVVE